MWRNCGDASQFFTMSCNRQYKERGRPWLWTVGLGFTMIGCFDLGREEKGYNTDMERKTTNPASCSTLL
jgi:hypothetical protein